MTGMKLAERINKLRQRRLRQDYRQTFATDHGHRVLMDLYHFCHLADRVHTQGDPCHTAHLDGMRRVALRIMSMMELDEEAIARMRRAVIQQQTEDVEGFDDE